MVPRAGVEPAHPKIQDFESSASANSAIWAYPRFGKKASCPLNARIRFLGCYLGSACAEAEECRRFESIAWL